MDLDPTTPSNPRERRSRAMLLGAVLALALAANVRAVSVSPVALYIDSRSRTGTLTLYNPGSRPEEIEVGFKFGYPVSDEAGNVSVPLVDTAPAGEPSAVEWVRAFPRRLVLEPGQRQTIRVLVEPPPGLPDGEYWARLLIRARGGQPPIEERRGDVTVQIEVETVVVVALSYRNGKVETGVRVTGGAARLGTTAVNAGDAAAPATDVVLATVDLERLGNAAYIGAIRAQLLDARGREIGEESEAVLAVYRGIRRRFELPVPTGTAPARVRIMIDSRRDDLPPGAALSRESVAHTIDIR